MFPQSAGKGKGASVSLQIFYSDQEPPSACPEGTSLKWNCGTVALSALSLEEDKVSSDDAMCVLAALPVSSLAGSD